MPEQSTPTGLHKKHFSLTTCALCVCAAGWSTPLYAEEDEPLGGLVEELILGESAYTQEQGEFQTTLGFEYSRGADEKTSTLTFELEYGITDWFQIGFEAPYRWIDTEADGFQDIEFSAAARLFSEDGFTLTAAGELELPTGDEDDELGEGNVTYEALLLGAWRQGDVELYSGIGFEFSENDQTAVSYSAAGVVEVTEPLALIVELAGEHADGEDEVRLAPGLRWALTDDLELVLGLPIGLSEDAADWGAVLKLSLEF